MYKKSCSIEQKGGKINTRVNAITLKSTSALPLSTADLSSVNTFTILVAVFTALYSFTFLFTDVPHIWTPAKQFKALPGKHFL